MLPDKLHDDTYKKALIFGKLAAKTYDYDDNQVAKVGLAFFSGIDDIKQQDFTTPNYKRVASGGGFIDILGGADSGLDYTVFEERNTGDVVLAFRGTEPLSIEDWGEDIKQALSFLVNGTSEQYAAAIKLAMNMADELHKKGKELSFTGHSLGGGLATAAALATGKMAIVFDAAGVSRGTISHIESITDVDIESHASNIINFNVKECFVSDPNTPLGLIQNAVDSRQYGRQYWLQSVSERANFIGLPDYLTIVKIAESILNHAWHVYTFQLQHKKFDPIRPLTYPALEKVREVSTATPPRKRQKLESAAQVSPGSHKKEG